MNYARAAQLLLCLGGIYGAYLTQGWVSEKLQTHRYGQQLERFPQLEALNGAQSLTCFVWAWVLLAISVRTGQTNPKLLPAWTAYYKAGLTNCIGPGFGMLALKNISYPAQILAKSCKMVPVMLMGTVLHGKLYSAVEYACMSLIGVGISIFAANSSSKVTSKLSQPNPGLGYTLCMLNLVCDGYTNAAQDQINKVYPKNSALHMMCWMNFWTSVYYGIYMFVITHSGTAMARFCSVHGEAGIDVLLFCFCGAVGQLFIFYTIKTFGSLVNTLICTTRKFFNILGSVVLNGNPLLPLQWLAVFMVFSGLLTSSLVKGRRHKSKQS